VTQKVTERIQCGFGPPICETVYISEGNGAGKVKADAQVAMNKNSDPVQEFFLRGGWEDGAPTEIFPEFPELSETSRARKLILGLQVNTDNNIDKASSRRYDVIR